jgi:sugar O-acyltransferase (sialic acid O-acetyltransferase NeuD family)
MKPVVLWGGTGQAKVLREALAGTDFEIIAVFDQRTVVPPFNDVPLYVGMDGFREWQRTRGSIADVHFCVAIGGGASGDRLHMHADLVAAGLAPLTVRHRAAFIATDASVGEGCQILAASTVATQARLGRCVIVNTAASVDHECHIGDGAHIGPGAVLAGEIRVGPRVFVGAGATILPRITIGEAAVIGAGAVVTRDVAPGTTVVGVPAREFHSPAHTREGSRD